MRFEHIDGVTVKAKFDKENSLRYRYWLEIFSKGLYTLPKTACVVMQNPSCASEDVADKSVQFMEKLVFQKGLPEFGGVQRLIVVNQFARIQTNGFQGLPHDIGSKNNQAIETALRESSIIIVGWGSGNPYEERKAFVMNLLTQMNGKQLYKTKKHPSRGHYEGFIRPFSI